MIDCLDLSRGTPPLTRAMRNGFVPLVTYLVEHGADVEAASAEAEAMVLEEAASTGEAASGREADENRRADDDASDTGGSKSRQWEL